LGKQGGKGFFLHNSAGRCPKLISRKGKKGRGAVCNLLERNEKGEKRGRKAQEVQTFLDE